MTDSQQIPERVESSPPVTEAQEKSPEARLAEIRSAAERGIKRFLDGGIRLRGIIEAAAARLKAPPEWAQGALAKLDALQKQGEKTLAEKMRTIPSAEQKPDEVANAEPHPAFDQVEPIIAELPPTPRPASVRVDPPRVA